MSDLLPDYWHDYVLEDWKDQLHDAGFEDAEIHYTGFWSQGDGASFTANVSERLLRLPYWLRRRLVRARQFQRGHVRLTQGPAAADKLRFDIDGSARITQSGHYCHEYTMSLDLTLDYSWDWPDDAKNALDAWATQREKELIELARDLAREIYRALEAEHDYQTAQLEEETEAEAA